LKNLKTQFSQNFTRINWKNPIFIISASMSIYIIISFFIYGSFHTTYGGDYLAYWSVGKIADQKGYSEIYDLNNLRSVQTQEFESLGVLERADASSPPIICVPYFSFFVLPFQILSKFELIYGFWLWTIFNLIILIGYLVFFLRKILPEGGAIEKGLKLLIPILISYPVLSNIFNGQVNVLLLVCAGECIRNAVRKKPILSGLWLGGVLIKPQLLILIIPIILIMRNWKVLTGFIASSGIILLTSFILSGFYGTKALINLWLGYSTGFATVNPEAMINWRMIGFNLNLLLNTSLGWIITSLGMVLTILALYFLIKQNPLLGSPSWVIMMLVVFSTTLAITWHAHNHMAMVLIPFLFYALLYKLLSEKILFLWATATQVVWFGMVTVGGFADYFGMVTVDALRVYTVMAVAISGFVLNLVILFSTIQFINNCYLKQY